MRATSIFALCISSSYAAGYVANFQCITSGTPFPFSKAHDNALALRANPPEHASAQKCGENGEEHGCCVDFNDGRDAAVYYPCYAKHACSGPNAKCVPNSNNGYAYCKNGH